MKAAVERVLAALAARGLTVAPVEFAESTRTAADAAAAIGTTVGQIVKSLVFLADGAPILVLTSGANQVDTALLGATLGRTITRAPAEIVRAATGYAIGGVPPVGHATPLLAYLDRDLLRYDVVWAAAGTPNAVFPVAPALLQTLAGAQVVTVTAAGDAPPAAT